VRYEFFYDRELPKLFLRVVTSFGDPTQTIDGVFAIRVGLHAMEILQGNEINLSVSHKRPPLIFGLRQQVNFVQQVLVGGILAILWGYIKMYLCILLEMLYLKKQPQDMTRVNDTASLFRFQDTDHASEPAVYQIFRSDPLAFKLFLDLLEEWRKTLGKRSFFYLINFSPLVAPGTTTNSRDIGRLEDRYRGAFDRPGVPPGDDIWLVQNCMLAKMIVVNNYGKHEHNFTAKPVGFMWDWLHLANAFPAAGCITINGVFISWFRGMPSSHQGMEFANVLGAPVAKATQNMTWNPTMRSGKKASPTAGSTMSMDKVRKDK
jgi:hypothetical protein